LQQRMKALVGDRSGPHLFSRVEVFEVMQTGAEARGRETVVKDAKSEQRLGGRSPGSQPSTDVAARRKHESVSAEGAAARACRRHLPASGRDRGHLPADGA